MRSVFSGSLFMLLFAVLFTASVNAQDNKDKILRSFPITDYITAGNDTMDIVQLYIPNNKGYMVNKQVALLKGIAQGEKRDTADKGAARCNLIKGDYYYFGISTPRGGSKPKPGDLMYTMVPRDPNGFYGDISAIGTHSIVLKDVYDTAFYTLGEVLAGITKEAEAAIKKAMVADIRYTGDYYLKEGPEMDKQLVNGGRMKGKGVLSAMKEAEVSDLQDFLVYMAKRPVLYAGNNWKVSEVFATWLTSGAPTVIRQ